MRRAAPLALLTLWGAGCQPGKPEVELETCFEPPPVGAAPPARTLDDAAWSIEEEYVRQLEPLGGTVELLTVGSNSVIWAAEAGGEADGELIPGRVRTWALGSAQGVASWEEEAPLLGPDGGRDWFGYSLSASLDGGGSATVAVGAPGYDPEHLMPSEFGGVYVYTGLDWTIADPVFIANDDTRRMGGSLQVFDYDGDGVSDLVSLTGDLGSPSHYLAYRFFRGPFEVDRAIGDADLVWWYTSQTTRPSRTQAVGTVGDINGDGVDDVFSGSYGGVIVYGGSAVLPDHSDPDVTIVGELAAEGGPQYFQPAGDVDGDGHGDVLFGDPYAADTLGRVYVALGPLPETLELADVGGTITGVLKDWAGWGDKIDTADEFERPGPPDDTAFPIAVGDIDGDGRSDVGSTSHGVAFSEDDRTTIHVFLGPVCTAHSVDEHDFAIEAPSYYPSWDGESFAAGDVDRDGRDDLLVGVPTQETTGVYLFQGAEF